MNNTMKKSLWLIITFLFQLPTANAEKSEINDYVPNKSVAIKIADAVLSQRYGKETINMEKPLTAKLDGDYWIIRGNLPNNMKGGETEIKLSKKTGEIIYAIHDK